MRLKHTLATGLALAGLALSASAQTGTTGPGSLSGSPAGQTGPDASMGAGSGLSMGGNMSPEVRSRAENHMRAMQDLRMRMQTATTAEQRQALMNEHMRLMDENMSLMQQMMMGSGGTLPGGPGAPGMPGGGMGTGPDAGGSGGSGGGPAGSPGSVR